MLSNIDSTTTNTTTTTCVYRGVGRRSQITSSDVTATVTSGESVNESNQNQGPSRATSTCSSSPVPKIGSEKIPSGGKPGKFYYSDGDVSSSVSNTSKRASDDSKKAFCKIPREKECKCEGSDSKSSAAKEFCSCRRWWKRKLYVTDSESDTCTMSRAEKDKRRFETVRERLRAWGERSTFHGVDVLMETPADWRRVFVFILLCIMTALCWICCGNMVLGFLNMSVTTVIDRDVEEFRFPAITVCPDSPFTMTQLEAEGDANQE